MILVTREGMLVRGKPDPFYLVFWIIELGYIVNNVTGVDTIPAILFCLYTFPLIHNHCPAFCKCLFLAQFVLWLALGHSIQDRLGSEPQNRKTGYLQKTS